jgi:hypothetical protein
VQDHLQTSLHQLLSEPGDITVNDLARCDFSTYAQYRGFVVHYYDSFICHRDAN